MKKFIEPIFFLFVVINLSACVQSVNKGSRVIVENPNPCCDVIIDRLLTEYPPAQTTLSLSKSNNAEFDTLLENTARKAGYTVGNQEDAVNISYVIDMMDEKTGYIHLKSSNGLVFSRMFKVPGYVLGDYYTEQNSEVNK
nr:conjugal transfer protein TrbH [uncultured Desulfobacter sp.]